MHKCNKIAILMATYNGEEYVSEQIESILKQSNQDWVLYVHDDGSNDRTMDIVNGYCDRYEGRIIVLEGASTGGAKNNFFYMLNQVEAPYYMFCDQDDYWLSDKIQKTLNRIQRNEIKAKQDLPMLVFTDLKIVDSGLNTICESMADYQALDYNHISTNRLLLQNVVTGCTVIINKSLRDRMTGCLDLKDIIMHDWWAALVATEFGIIDYLNEQTILYRQHGRNTIGAKRINDLPYIFSKLSNPIGIKQGVEATFKQAFVFSYFYKLDDDNLISKYANLAKKHKMYRLLFYLKHGIKKSGIFRNIGMVLFG